MSNTGVAAAVDYIARWVDYRRRTIWLPGVAYAVAYDGETVDARAFGVADLDSGAALTAEHRFRIASQSKMLTATAVGRLVELGRVRLDDTVGAHVSGLGAGIAALTLRDLLSHGSGTIRDGADAAFWELLADFPSGDGIGAVAGADPVLPPLSRFKYSNVGYGLLGRVIESAGGAPYADWVEREVTRPLGMAATRLDLGRDDGPLATGHTSGAGGEQRRTLGHAPARAFAAAAGGCSTVSDMARFASAQRAAADSVIGAATRRTLHQVQWVLPGRPPRSYALGFAWQEVGERRLVGHGGAYPGFITHTMVDPGDGLALVVMTNAIDGPAVELATSMCRLVDLALEVAREPALPGTDAVPLDRYEGSWSGLWHRQDIVRFGDRLVAFDPTLADPVEFATRLAPDGDHLRIADGPAYGPIGEPVRLVDGGLQWAGHRLHRVSD